MERSIKCNKDLTLDNSAYTYATKAIIKSYVRVPMENNHRGILNFIGDKNPGASAEILMDERYTLIWVAAFRHFGYAPPTSIRHIEEFFHSEEFDNAWSEYMVDAGFYGRRQRHMENLNGFRKFLNVHRDKSLVVSKETIADDWEFIKTTLDKCLEGIASKEIRGHFEKGGLGETNSKIYGRFYNNGGYMESLVEAMLTTPITLSKMARFNEMVEEYNLEWAKAMFDWDGNYYEIGGEK